MHQESASEFPGGSSLLEDLPAHVLALVSKSLQPRDLCNMSLTCKKLNLLLNSDEVWWQQCIQVVEKGPDNLQAWRNAVSSYKIICRFLVGVKPLLGIWVHQNPELGNMVFVMWGFMSVVGCRIIPQELGPLGFDGGLLWAPVFEVIGNEDGSLYFFLHGREKDKDFCYPGSLRSAKGDCNVLFLEVEPRPRAQSPVLVFDESNRLSLTRNGRFSSSASAKFSQMALTVNEAASFARLGFGDRRRLLEFVSHEVRLKMPASASGPMFAMSDLSTGSTISVQKESIQKDFLLLSERRNLLMWMQNHGDSGRRSGSSRLYSGSVSSAVALNSLCRLHDIQKDNDQNSFNGNGKNTSDGGSSMNGVRISKTEGKDKGQALFKKLSFAKIVKERMRQITGMGAGSNDGERGSFSSRGDSRRLQLQEFLRQGEALGLCLHPCNLKLSMYRAWPIMHDNRFALYKMAPQKPSIGREFAGVWGGTFEWPAERHSEEKSGKALFFLLLSYEESDEGTILIATKILEGTHYVIHPNGSAMFVVKVNEPSFEKFPSDVETDPGEIVQAYQGEGIATGYGFRYPGSKPGDLFVCKNGLLMFVWRETKKILTLQRMDLQSLLRNGERVAPLPPIANFAYLTRSYSNVFAGYSGLTSCLASTNVKPL